MFSHIIPGTISPLLTGNRSSLLPLLPGLQPGSLACHEAIAPTKNEQSRSKCPPKRRKQRKRRFSSEDQVSLCYILQFQSIFVMYCLPWTCGTPPCMPPSIQSVPYLHPSLSSLSRHILLLTANNVRMGIVGLPNVGKSTFFNAL